MEELPKIHNPDGVAVLMPPSISKSWLLDFLVDKLGGTPTEGQGLMLKEEAHVNIKSEVQVIVHTITYDVDQVSTFISKKKRSHFSKTRNNKRQYCS